MFKSEIKIIKEIEFDKENYVKFGFNDMIWQGAKRKDFFYNECDWQSLLVPGTVLRLWSIQTSRVIGIEFLDENKKEFKNVWVAGNDF